MTERPAGRDVDCPECDAEVLAIVPRNGRVADVAEEADGKVWATCRNCGERFLVYYQLVD